jgi:hypothetical protein
MKASRCIEALQSAGAIDLRSVATTSPTAVLCEVSLKLFKRRT